MPEPLPVEALAVMVRLTSETGQPLQPLSWWDAVLEALKAHVVLVLRTPTQDGKSTFLLALAVATLLTLRDKNIVFVAPSVDGGDGLAMAASAQDLAFVAVLVVGLGGLCWIVLRR